ncbi:hypothetical protein GQ41_3637 [Arenibacter algicola]|uniref:Uncharacterized protein n=1 Tax=Arenibacter algicola TaxID=616991 RepID=A0ABY3AEQ6_9FLAO
MLEEKLQTLVKEYPNYSGVILAIVKWFRNNPSQKDIRMDVFYSNHFNYSIEEINAAFMIMTQEDLLKPVYRILDDDGSKIGKDFKHVRDIPQTVSTIWGKKKETKDVYIVPFYSLD